LVDGVRAVEALADFVIATVVLAEVVMDVQTGHPRGEPLARLVHAEQL
jgi:hypothetical protein